jgi:hypothetical protein
MKILKQQKTSGEPAKAKQSALTKLDDIIAHRRTRNWIQIMFAKFSSSMPNSFPFFTNLSGIVEARVHLIV